MSDVITVRGIMRDLVVDPLAGCHSEEGWDIPQHRAECDYCGAWAGAGWADNNIWWPTPKYNVMCRTGIVIHEPSCPIALGRMSIGLPAVIG